MFELTIGEYEDTQTLGTYATEDEALIALGRYVLAHPHEGSLHPHITPVPELYRTTGSVAGAASSRSVCEACGGPVAAHPWVDLDSTGVVVRCPDKQD